MIEVLQFYVSGFWTWAGITFALIIVGQVIISVVHSIARRNAKQEN